MVVLTLAQNWITCWLAEDYLFSSLKIRWRRWMTDRYLKDWLRDRAHYLGQLDGQQGDNPDQRISEDIRSFVFTTLDLGMQLFSAIAALPELTYVTIAHRASLRQVHTRHLRIAEPPGGEPALHEDDAPPVSSTKPA